MTTTYPNASTTGVPQGTNLSQYTGTLHVTTDNAVIENLEVNGNIIIDAENVTLKNIKLTTGDFHGIQVMDSATGFTLMDSEINGTGTAHNGIFGFGTILRTNIYGTENGISASGAGPMLIQDNYIHGMAGDASSHFDSIEINGGHDIQILHNTIINEHGQTSAIMLDNWAGGLSNINIDGNYLEGGGYTVYLDDRFGGGAVDDASISITNNQVGGGGYGDFALYGNNPVMSGNVGLGEPVPAAVVSQPSESTAIPVTETSTVVTPEAGSGAVSGEEGTAAPGTSAGTDANAGVSAEAGSGAVSGEESTAAPVTSTGTVANAGATAEAGSGAVSGDASLSTTGTDANAGVSAEAGSGAVSGEESTAAPVTSTGTDANAGATAEAGSGAVSGDASSSTTGTDANAGMTTEAGSGAVSGDASSATTGSDANAGVTAEAGSGAVSADASSATIGTNANAKAAWAADHASGGALADKIWFGHHLSKSSDADHHSNFDASDFDVSSAWTGVRGEAAEHGANALDGDGHSVYDAAFEGHHLDHSHTPPASDWLF